MAYSGKTKQAGGGNPPRMSKQAAAKAAQLTNFDRSGMTNLVNYLMGGHGISTQELHYLDAGKTGGVKQFAGLSPAALKWLGQSGLLQAQAAQPISTAGLTGAALANANAMNAMIAKSPLSYQLSQGTTGQQLAQMLQAAAMMGGLGQGGRAFNAGYGTSGMAGAGLWNANPYNPKYAAYNPGGSTGGTPGSTSTAGGAATGIGLGTGTGAIAVPGI